LSTGSTVDIQVIVLFVAIGVAGSWLGRMVNQRLDQQTLKRVFAIFLILLGGFVIVREGAKLLPASKTASSGPIVQQVPFSQHDHPEFDHLREITWTRP
jgi:hypothetical protein